jgi:hypothetical protein
MDWADWLPPTDLAARVRLEFARVMYPASAGPDEIKGWDAGPDTIDSERLLSASLRCYQAQGPIENARLQKLSQLDRHGWAELMRRTPAMAGETACLSHQETPPLFITVAEMIAANGQVDSALEQLQSVIAQSSRFPLDVVRHADRALLRILRRMRLRDEGAVGGGSLLNQPTISDRMLLWALDGLDAGKSRRAIPTPSADLSLHDRLETTHAIWRSIYARSADDLVQAVDFARQHLVGASDTLPDRPTFVQVALKLDLIEAHMLAQLHHDSFVSPEAWRFDPGEWWQANQTRPQEALRLWIRASMLGRCTPAGATIPNDLPLRLGMRRAAEIAFNEAELLTLRLPQMTIFGLRQARHWFEQCNDLVGVLICEGLIALIYAQSPDGNLAATMTQIESAYMALQSRSRHTWAHNPLPASSSRSKAMLPEWKQLTHLAAHPSDHELDALDPPAWRPWLMRIVICLNRQLDPHAHETAAASAVLYQWVHRHYGVVGSDGGVVEVPADFGNWLEPPATTPIPAPDPHELARPISLAAHEPEGATSLATLAQLRQQISRYFDTGELRDLVDDLGLGDWIARTGSKLEITSSIITYVASRGLVSVFRQSVARLRPDIVWDEGMESAVPPEEQWRSIEEASLLLMRVFRAPESDSASTSFADSQPVHVSLTLHARARERSNLGSLVGRVDIPNTATYTQVAVSLPQSIREALGRLSAELAARTLEVIVEPEEGLHGPCWEAVVALNTQLPSDLPADLPFRFSRRRPESRHPRSLARTAAPLVVSWGATDLARAMVKRGWEPLSQASRFTFEARRAATLHDLSTEPERVRILHLVGRADESYSGINFCVDSKPHIRASKTASAAQPKGGSTWLIQASEVARTFPNLAVCILQGEPGSADGPRRDVERRDATLARAFAADLFAQGIPVVLVLPLLDASVGAAVLHLASKAIADDILPGSNQFLQVIVDIQNLIVERCKANSLESAWELALDVCIYTYEQSAAS